jgi:hypothetical protein
MVKGCTLFESAQWFKSKNSVGFGQYSSIEINKADTIYCGLPFSLQAFESSGPREPPPQSLTQPDVNLSVHPAPIDQPIVVPVASAQTGKTSVSQCAQASKRPCVCDGATFCISAWPIVAMRH